MHNRGAKETSKRTSVISSSLWKSRENSLVNSITEKNTEMSLKSYRQNQSSLLEQRLSTAYKAPEITRIVNNNKQGSKELKAIAHVKRQLEQKVKLNLTVVDYNVRKRNSEINSSSYKKSDLKLKNEKVNTSINRATSDQSKKFSSVKTKFRGKLKANQGFSLENNIFQIKTIPLDTNIESYSQTISEVGDSINNLISCKRTSNAPKYSLNKTHRSPKLGLRIKYPNTSRCNIAKNSARRVIANDLLNSQPRKSLNYTTLSRIKYSVKNGVTTGEIIYETNEEEMNTKDIRKDMNMIDGEQIELLPILKLNGIYDDMMMAVRSPIWAINDL